MLDFGRLRHRRPKSKKLLFGIFLYFQNNSNTFILLNKRLVARGAASWRKRVVFYPYEGFLMGYNPVVRPKKGEVRAKKVFFDPSMISLAAIPFYLY
jgi:hypothetical protein